MSCPGSAAALRHASCELRVTFPRISCARVHSEALARIAAGPDFDPHHHGTYSLLSNDNSTLVGERVTGSAAPGRYTDRFQLTFTVAPTGCEVTACSESQGNSFYDDSTNYCNLHVLWCNVSSGCPSINEPGFTYTETIVSCSALGRSQHDAAQCTPETLPPTPPTLPPTPPSPIPPLLDDPEEGPEANGDSTSPPPPAAMLPLHTGDGDGNHTSSLMSLDADDGTLTLVLIAGMVLLALGFGIHMGIQRRKREQMKQSAAERRRRATEMLGQSSASRATDFDDGNDEWELNDAAREAQEQEVAASKAMAAPSGGGVA